MIMDKQLELSNAQAITATAVSTNVVDLGDQNWAGTAGGEHGPEFHISVGATFVSAGASTLTIEFITSANADMSSPLVLEQSGAIAKADLVAGARVAYTPRLPAANVRRYIAMRYVVGAGPFTAGTLTTRGVTGRQTNR